MAGTRENVNDTRLKNAFEDRASHVFSVRVVGSEWATPNWR